LSELALLDDLLAEAFAARLAESALLAEELLSVEAFWLAVWLALAFEAEPTEPEVVLLPLVPEPPPEVDMSCAVVPLEAVELLPPLAALLL
jgi:hypothetical protein